MATTFGARPEDTVADSRGNVLSGVVLSLYPTQADATAQTSLIAAVSTNSKGLWPYSDDQSRSLLWVRDPNGSVWPTGSQEALGSVGGKADQTYVDAGLATKPSKQFLGMEIPSTINDITALQAAADTAATNGTKVWAAGTITTSATLTLKSDADLSQVTINYTGSGAAVVIGDASIANFRKTIVAPKVVASAKTVNGWAQVAGTVGVDIVNAYAFNVTIPYIKNCETGLRLRGANSNGTQQTTINLGHLDNNLVNMRFTGDATGWANQNYIFGGRCSHNSNEGVQVAGTRHLLFENIANPVNSNHFYGTSLESPNVVEYHAEFASTQWNQLVGCRWENTGSTASRRILVSGTSKNNHVVGGAYGEDLTQTIVGGTAQPVDVTSPAFTSRRGGGASSPTMLLENLNSNSAPSLTVMGAGAGNAGTSPSTGYCLKVSANQMSGKRSTDSFDRTIWDMLNGRFYVGDASASPVAYIGATASSMLVGGGVPLAPAATGTQDLGLTSLKWRKLLLSGDVDAAGDIRPLSTKTANYTLVGTTDNTVVFNGTSLTATLPDPTSGVVPGRRLTVKNINSTALTVNSAGTSKTLDGAASQSLAQWAKATYVSDGTQWLTVA